MYSQSLIDPDRHTDSLVSAPRKWSRVSDYPVDRGGPLFRPYRRTSTDFATVPVLDHLRQIAEGHSAKLAINDGGNRLTYSELLQKVESLSGRIAAAVATDEAVGILLVNSVWDAVILLATMAAGRLAVPLDARDPVSRINEIARAARLATIVGARPGGIDLGQDVRWIDATSGLTSNNQQAVAQAVSPSVDAPAIAHYATVSTDQPQGIVNSQRALLRRVQDFIDACHIDADDVFLPLSAPTTMSGCEDVLAALLSGATLHLFDAEAIGLAAIRDRMGLERVTIVSMTPTLLRAIMTDHPAADFSSLRLVRIGGEKVSWTDISLLRKAIPDACLVQIGYSSTVTTGSQWFLPRDWPEQGASVPAGWLLPGITFAIVDEEGCRVRPGESGELLIRSPHVLLGHWENGALVPTESDPDDPELRIVATGDLVRLDDGGLLHFIGRKGPDDVVKTVLSERTDDRLARSREISPPIVFLLPGSLGYGPSLTDFAVSMSKVARLAPIRYPDLRRILDGQNTLSAMAAAAVEQINRLQPLGPIRLLGHSLGGAVAFEVTARLLAAGRSVRFVGILDTSLMGERSSYWEMITRTIHRIRANRVTAARMACRAIAKVAAAIGCEARLARIIDRYTKGQFDVTCFRIRLELQEVLRAKAYFRWLTEPKSALPIAATLFRCDREGMPLALGWDRAFARVDVVAIAGGHIDLVMQPHLATNGPLIERVVMQTYSPAESSQTM